MKKYIILFASLLFAGTQVSGQVLERQVIGAMGNSVSVSGLQADFTVGETITKMSASGNLIITQGFHQPTASTTGINDAYGTEIQATVFPNPVEDILQLRIAAPELRSVQVQLSDVHGRVLLTETYPINGQAVFTAQLPLGHLAQGTYFLRLADGANVQRKVFKVVRK